MNTAQQELPPGVTRCRHCRTNVGLHNCDAIQLYFASGRSVIVWSSEAKYAWPLDRSKRLRDLRHGDAVLAFGVEETIERLEVYR